MSTEVEVKDIDALQSAIANVRSDSNPVNWMLAKHVDGNPDLLSFFRSGTGGAAEMSQYLSDAEVMYGLVRFTETVDMSETIKFAYIRWVGEKVSFVKRGKFGVVHGSVEKYFQPYHGNIDIDRKEDVTEEALIKRLQTVSGSRSS